ncbi:hypothetical protein H4Q26_001552 [Puccinia striiformis f. sp. tritici PST-130]|nr:hypothetical protein H4Q26_001552 [Puccinia striiformis f. sp. tritici PST-130]
MPRTTRRSTRTPIPEEDAEALPPPKTTKPKSTTSLPRSRSTRSIRSQEPSTITDDTEIKAKSTKKTKKSTASTSTDLDPPQPAKRQRRSAQIRSRSRASTPPDEEEVAVKVENEDNDQNQEGEQNAEEGEEEVEEVEKEQEEEEPEEGQDEVEREQDETERDQDQTDKEDEPEEAGENQSEEIADVARNEEHGQAAADLPHPVDTENEPSAVASKENSAEDYTDSRDKQNDSPATPATVMPTPVHPVTPPKTPPVRRRPLTPMKLALDDLNRAGEPRLVIDRIVLDGSDEFNVIPNSKLVVARIATRNNMSKYTIDGKLSNFAEVTTLLKAKGIDLDHKRFLILQGEVESIAQMKPKATTAHDEGLLEYLEDIIGTNRFKEPIEQTQQTLEEVASKRSQQLERVKLVEREKVALGARKKVADEYLARMNTLVQQQNLLWQFYIHTGQTNLEKLTGSMNAIDNKVKENEEAHAGDLQENEALRVELEQEEGAYKDVEVETDALVKELGRKERELVSLTEKMKHGKTKQKKLKKSITEDEHILKEAAATIRDGQEEIEILKVEVESKEKLIEKEEVELDQIRDSLKDKTQVFADQIEVKQAELAPWAAQVTSKKAALDLATSERDLLLKKATDFSSALASAQETVTKIDEETKAKKAELKQLKLEHAEYQEGIDGAAAELKKLDNEEAKLRTKLTTARQKADEAKTARTTSSSKNEVLKSLSKLHKQGRLSGFFGRLGDLGRIDDMYDVAISTACPQLDNLVCDTVDTGQQCLAHLKKTNAGRAVIICLDALKTNAPAAAPATPENAPRLVDLVTTQEPMFKAAFYHVLRDTLVAKDLTQANRIAFGNGSGKRWRVVTLDGKLIDSSGTMSGGGTRVARGLMSSKMTSNDTEISEEVVARLEQDTVSAEAEIAQHSGNRSEIQAELRRLQSEQPKLEMRITKLEMDIGGATKRKEEAKKTILELGSEDRAGSNDDAEVKHLESVMEKLEAELQELRRKTGKIEQSIKDLQEKILEVGGVRLRTQQSKVKDLKAMVEHANNRLTKAEVGRSKAERDTSKHEKTLKKSIAELEVLEGEISELEAKVHSNSSETEAMKDTVDQARMALEEQKERLQDIQERRKEKLKIMNVFQLSQTELKQQREKVEAALAQSAANVKHWNEKQASLKLNLIEDDEDDEEELERREAAQVLKQYSAVDFEDFDAELTKAEVAKLEEDQERASPDLGVLKEYAQREAEFMARAADLERTTRARDEAKQLLEDLNQQRLEEFMWGFQIISGKLKEMYQMITLGGNAELELVDSLDPFSEGIIFSVMPPKKSWKNISNLSGGEKTLSSLALVFALHAFKPTPLYFMDEIDAALDFRNVSIIGNYIKDRTKNAQFIIISLRNNMFELSRRLVGIYKTSNCTKSIAVDNTELNEVPN